MKKSTWLFLTLCLIMTAILSVAISAATYGNYTEGTYGDLTYTMADGKVAIIRCRQSATSISIPESINGYPVVLIGGRAFEGYSTLKHITIPSSVIAIGNYAFYGCFSLEDITIPSSVITIGEHAFLGCNGLKDLEIPSSVTAIGSGAFENCRGLTNVTLSQSMTSIEWFLFKNCSSLTSITLPSSVTVIGNGAFADCSALTSITIPASVTGIGNAAFFRCSSLTSVVFATGSKCTSISEAAFQGCNLTSITLPPSMTYISYGAFSSNLRTLTFADGWKLDSGYALFFSAFDHCALTDVYYSGTRSEWDSIVATCSEKPFANAMIHCSDSLKHEDRKDAVVLGIGKLNASVFGQTVACDGAPKIVNNRTMVPVRFIAEALGATVGWDGNTRKVTLAKGGKRVEIVIDAAKATVNGAEVLLDSPAFIENGRTYLPLRFVVESLDAAVEWDGDAREIIITGGSASQGTTQGTANADAPSGFVIDNASLFGAAEIAELATYAAEVEKAIGLRCVFLTGNSLGDLTSHLAEYADGAKDLSLVAVDMHAGVFDHYQYNATMGVNGFRLNNKETDDILDKMLPYMQDGDFVGAAKTFISLSVKYFMNDNQFVSGRDGFGEYGYSEG